MARLVRRRLAIGLVTLFLVSVVVFLATEVLPGNAAYAILGHEATPARVRSLEAELHLNRGLFDQYWVWVSGLFSGNLGDSLANGLPVWGYVEPRLVNSALSARRPRWCRPWIEPSDRPVRVAISVGESPAKCRNTSTSH